MDETSVKVAGRRHDVYRAVDQHGQIIAVYVSARRDTQARDDRHNRFRDGGAHAWGWHVAHGGGTCEGVDRTRRQNGVAMFISSLLRAKGTFVATIEPDRTVADLVQGLARHNVGALVVSADGRLLDGVVSERDVARHLDRDGARLLEMPVSAIMTPEVRTCSPHDSVEDVMLTMTHQRVRHVPVVEEGRLVGIVSIGDLVKSRLDELQGERDDLINYISH